MCSDWLYFLWHGINERSKWRSLAYEHQGQNYLFLPNVIRFFQFIFQAHLNFILITLRQPPSIFLTSSPGSFVLCSLPTLRPDLFHYNSFFSFISTLSEANVPLIFFYRMLPLSARIMFRLGTLNSFCFNFYLMGLGTVAHLDCHNRHTLFR